MGGPGSVRVGILFLAEAFLKGFKCEMINFSEFIHITNIVDSVGQKSIENALSVPVSHWFPNVISEKLSSAMMVIILKLCTTLPTFKSSLRFTVGTLLPSLSHLLNCEHVQDWDVGLITSDLVATIQTFNPENLKQEIEKMDVEIHQDLEEILTIYLQN